MVLLMHNYSHTIFRRMISKTLVNSQACVAAYFREETHELYNITNSAIEISDVVSSAEDKRLRLKYCIPLDRFIVTGFPLVDEESGSVIFYIFTRPLKVIEVQYTPDDIQICENSMMSNQLHGDQVWTTVSDDF